MNRSMLLLAVLCIGCSTSKEPELDLQGHRGARGLMPENTIPGFLHALDLGVTTLEMDLVVTGDGQLLVSHEPIISAEICLDTLGGILSDSLAHSLNIYQMSYADIQAYDCGSKPHPRFPDQKKMQVAKPLFRDVVIAVKDHLEENKMAEPNYNIELKSMLTTDNAFHPIPSEFSDLAFGQISSLLSWDKVTIQSFDFRILQYFHANYPSVRLVLLIENNLSYQVNIDSLGFKPDVYSCYFPLLTREIVQEIQSTGIKVVPWTVNGIDEMERLVSWGVDGIISDYPDKYSRFN